jgi:hypothetical protein
MHNCQSCPILDVCLQIHISAGESKEQSRHEWPRNPRPWRRQQHCPLNDLDAYNVCIVDSDPSHNNVRCKRCEQHQIPWFEMPYGDISSTLRPNNVWPRRTATQDPPQRPRRSLPTLIDLCCGTKDPLISQEEPCDFAMHYAAFSHNCKT